VMKQVSGGATIVYVYDASGNLAAEYSTAAAQSACGTPTCYVSVDHLGSTRLVTDSAGNVTQRYDYLPFGEEIPAALGGRTTTMGYEANPAGAPDGFNPKFTGQVRDVESGLDYFNARYYSPEQGRFVSVDPGNAGSDPSDPQTWNGYAYVGGNPLALTDPSGESWLSWLGIGLDILGALIGDPALGIGADLGLSASAAVTTSQVLLTAGSTLAGVGIMGGAPAGGLGGLNGVSDGPWNEQVPIGGGFVGPLNTGGVFDSGQTGPFVFSMADDAQGATQSTYSVLLPYLTDATQPPVFTVTTVGRKPLLTKKGGTYLAYAGCLVGKVPAVLAASAGLSTAGAIAAGKSLGNVIPPPEGLPLKAPKMLVNGQKWGGSSQIVGALVFVATFEVQLNVAARSCSSSEGYTPWVFE